MIKEFNIYRNRYGDLTITIITNSAYNTISFSDKIEEEIKNFFKKEEEYGREATTKTD